MGGDQHRGFEAFDLPQHECFDYVEALNQERIVLLRRADEDKAGQAQIILNDHHSSHVVVNSPR